MPKFLNTTGRTTLAIGVCDRCNRKFPLEMLKPDRNTPGLMVCDDDNDEYDPYRLEPRVEDRTTICNPRPDEGFD